MEVVWLESSKALRKDLIGWVALFDFCWPENRFNFYYLCLSSTIHFIIFFIKQLYKAVPFFLHTFLSVPWLPRQSHFYFRVINTQVYNFYFKHWYCTVRGGPLPFPHWWWRPWEHFYLFITKRWWKDVLDFFLRFWVKDLGILWGIVPLSRRTPHEGPPARLWHCNAILK